MQEHRYRMWQSKAVAFLMFALLAASTAYWALRSPGGAALSGGPAPAVAGESTLDPLAVARALGGGQAASAAQPGVAASSDSRRFALVGVLAGTVGGGAALISVDGKPARPYRVGAAVDERLVLQSVQGRRALLGTSMVAPADITLELPALDKR